MLESESSATHTALFLSAAHVGVGALLIVLGAAVGVAALFVAGAAAGALSLGAALYWRSELVSAWKRDRRRLR